MKTSLITQIFVLILCSSGLFAQEAMVADSLHVKVTGHKKVAGSTLYVALVDADDKEVGQANVAVDGTEEELHFSVAINGASTVAVRMFQDLDGDEEMGRGAFGIPNEPFGFSNNPEIRFGPPALSKMLVDLKEKDHIHIIMQ